MAITRNPTLIGISDPKVLKTVEGQLYKAAVIANGNPTVKNSELILPFTTVATGPKLVNVTTNSTNEAGDVVTVYSAQGNVYVSSIDQTIRNTTVNQVGVTTIVAGNNVSISSTSGTGTGTVTINSTGGGAADPGGATTQIQFNNAGTFGGTANITWTGTNFRVNTPNIQLGNAAGVGQGLNAVAVGAGAGASNQGANAVAVGYLAGYATQGIGAVAVGTGAGNSNQNSTAVAVGTSAGATTQGNSAVAVGLWAGYDTQGNLSVAVGAAAGQYTQGDTAVAIGYYAGNNTQGGNAVAIGTSAGSNTQGTLAVAIGANAAFSNQGENSIAVGSNAGYELQGNSSVAVGYHAGYSTQGIQSVSVGYYAGLNTQGGESVAIGSSAGHTSQGGNSVAIGSSAGTFTQGENSVAIGPGAGTYTQGANAVAIGSNAGNASQATNSIVINATGADLDNILANSLVIAPIRNDLSNVANAIYYNTATKEVSYGPAGSGGIPTWDNLGDKNNVGGPTAIALGRYAGSISPGLDTVAIGSQAGYTSQGDNGLAIGRYAGYSVQGQSTVAIGGFTGYVGQGGNSVAVGSSAGAYVQGLNSVAIGHSAGLGFLTTKIFVSTVGTTLVVNSTVDIAVNMQIIGSAFTSGQYVTAVDLDGVTLTISAAADSPPVIGATLFFIIGQSAYAVAIGAFAGTYAQGANSVALGATAGYQSQGAKSVAIGYYAGSNTQGEFAIAIGANAGYTSQANNSIVINATGISLENTTEDSLVIAPIRNDLSNVANALYYNTATKEVSYGPAAEAGTPSMIANGTSNVNIATVNGNVVITTAGANSWTFGIDDLLTVPGNITGANVITANFFVGNGSSLTSLTGANVSGAVSFATTANAVAGANVSGAVSFATTANAVAGANVSGAVSNATYAGIAGTANAVAGANVSGAVSFATTANAVAGANVSGTVANATYAVSAGSATTAGTVTTNAQSNITSVGTLTELGVSGTITAANITANTGVFTGNGNGLSSLTGANVSGAVSFATTANAVAGANVSGAVSFATTANAVAGANVSGAVSFATTANAVAGGNVSGTVANATYATTSGTSYSVAVGNVSGIGNIATTNLDGSSSNVLYGNGAWAAISISIISNGTSNVSIPIGSSNVNLTAAGNTTLVITGTGATITGTANVSGGGSFGANVNLNSNYITSLHDPVTAQDAATKNYVDTVASGLHVHQSAYVATIIDLDTATGGTVAYNNGASGVGANLVTTGTFFLIDGGNVQTVGTRILVKDEANQAWNGVYTYDSTNTIIRATDFDTTADVLGGDFLFVTSGDTLADTGWVQTTDNVVIGTSNIVFDQFSGVGTYKAGTGLTLTGQVFSVNASQTQVTSVGTLTSLLVGNATANTTFGNGTITALGNVTAANFIGTLANGTSNVSIPTSNGNIVITAGANAWTLGTTGTLTFPVNNATQQTITGTTQLIQGDPYPVMVASNAVSTIWTASSANVTSAKIVLRVSYGAGSAPDNVEMLDIMIAKADTAVAFNVSNKLKTDDAWADTEIDVALDGSTLIMTTANAQASGEVDVFYTYSATEFNTTYD